jgi:curved DNA-binding protein CbpA
MDINKEDEPMNIQIALILLDITDIELTQLTPEYIKRKYHKMALRNHPDKNGNTTEATKKFQRINEAYTYLSKELTLSSTDHGYENNRTNSNIFNDFVSSFDFMDEKNKYKSILTGFLSNILRTESIFMREALTRIIQDIVINGAKVISLKLIEDLDKDKSIELFNFLYKYKNILYIDSETLELVSSLIREKYKNDSVYVLNPSIDDLLDSNIYKLYINGRLFLVPLWHSEMYFDDTLGNEIIVLCKPELPDHVTIDENNNLYYELLVPFEKEMILPDSYFTIQIGKRTIKIPIIKLYIKQEQIYVLKSQGIPKIIEDDVYNVSSKGDIIISIRFQ